MSEGVELVRAAGLSKHFGGIFANDAVEFSVEEGDLIGLIGPNGSGKTTLINMLTGHLMPDGGEVILRGRRVSGRPAHFFAGNGGGADVPADAALRPHDGAGEHARARADAPALPLARRREARARLPRVPEPRARCDLNAKNLSGGQQKLLELGRCLMLDPAVLFLDEPFAGVHPQLRDELLKRIQELHRSGRTFVVVDHDMESILRISRRLVVMARGRKIADGPPDAVRTDQAVLAAYAGL